MPKIDLTNEATRAYAYRVALAVLALLVVYGVLGSNMVESWDRLITAILGLGAAGLATKNTSTKG